MGGTRRLRGLINQVRIGKSQLEPRLTMAYSLPIQAHDPDV